MLSGTAAARGEVSSVEPARDRQYSSASAGVFNEFVMWVCTPETPGFVGRAPMPAGDRLIVSEGLAVRGSTPPMVRLFIVPEAAAGILSGMAWASALQHNVDDALRSFDVAARHCHRWARIHNRSVRRDHPDGTHQACGGRNILRQQTTENIEARGVGDRLDRIYAALDLRIAAGEIDYNQWLCDTPAVCTLPGSNAHRHCDLYWLIADAVVVQKIFGGINTRAERAAGKRA